MAALDKPTISPHLIGRDREIAILERAVRAAVEGRGQAFLIAGDAGVGKSRLVSELTTRAATLGLYTIRAQSFEQDAAYPYSLWIDALRGYLANTPPDQMSSSFGPYQAELHKLLPEIAYSIPESTYAIQYDPETEKRRVFEAIAYFFTNLAGTQPLLLILEDVHWSDKSTLDFLHFFIRRLSTLPLLLLITYRYNEASPSLQHLIAQLDRERLCNEIILNPLSRPEVEKLLGSLLDSSRPSHSQLTESVYAYTEGNPFYIEEILKLWLASGEIQVDEGRLNRVAQRELHIPRSVLDTIQQRTEHLSPAARTLLTVAAVVGRRFDFALLSYLLSLSESDQVAQIKELIASQLVIEESADQFAFRHALTREAVYASLLRRERKQLHRQIAGAISTLYASTLDRHLGALAYHAYEGELWQQTLEYSIRAGEQAQSLYAAGEAVEHYSRAIEAAHQLKEMPSIALFRARGKAFEMVGEFEQARADYEQTLTQAKQARDGLAEWQALLDLGFLWAAHDYAVTGSYFQQALELARAINQPDLIAHSLNRVGNWYANVEQPAIALQFHLDALALFTALNDQRGITEGNDLLGMAYQLNSDLLNSYQAFQRAIDLWRNLQDDAGLAATLGSLPLCAPIYLKDLDLPAISLQQAISAGNEARQIFHRIGLRAGETFVLFILAMALGAHGDYEEALEAAESSLRYAEEIEHLQWKVGAHVALGTLYLELLAFDSALLHLRRATSLAQTTGSKVWIGASAAYLASTHTAIGAPKDALALLDELLPPGTPMQMQWHRLMWFARAEALLASGDALHADEITEALIAAAPHRTPESAIPRLWLLHGKSLAAQGKTEPAISLLLAAITSAQEHNALPIQWRIHIALADLYRNSGQATEAQDHFAAARSIVDQLAASLAREHIAQHFIEQAATPFPTAQSTRPAALTPKQAAKQEFGGLTSREREIALLLAQGKSNQEIATELVVGVRTVEAHITRILTKLDFTSRVQVATWVIERKLAPPQDDGS